MQLKFIFVYFVSLVNLYEYVYVSDYSMNGLSIAQPSTIFTVKIQSDSQKQTMQPMSDATSDHCSHNLPLSEN